MILSVDIGGTFIKWAVADGYDFIVKGKTPTPRDSFDSLVHSVSSILDENSQYDIKGVAVSYPGMESPETGKMVPIGALEYGLNQPVRQMLSDVLKLPVSLENDGRLAALAEAKLGSLKGAKSGYVLVVGTGIGGAYVKNDVIETGAHGYAGQASLILTDNLRTQGVNAIFSRHTGMHDFLEHAGGILKKENLSGEEFMRMVKADDDTAKQLFNEYMDAFTNVLFTLQMVLDPEVFVIGGGISADKTYIRTMQEKYEELYKAFGLDLPHAEIKPAAYRNDANILGALCLFYSEHEEK